MEQQRPSAAAEEEAAQDVSIRGSTLDNDREFKDICAFFGKDIEPFPDSARFENVSLLHSVAVSSTNL